MVIKGLWAALVSIVLLSTPTMGPEPGVEQSLDESGVATEATVADDVAPPEASPPELAVVAADLKVSEEEAAELLRLQSAAHSYMLELSDLGIVVDYRGPFGDGATVVVEPGSLNSSIVENAPDGLTVREASLSRKEREDAHAAIEAAAAGIVGKDTLDVVFYDVLQNDYAVWVNSTFTDPGEAAVASRLIRSAVDANPTASITVRPTVQFQQARGGQTTQRKSGLLWFNHCTTTFGVNTGSGGAYLTAGHCDPHSYRINGNLSTSTIGQSEGGYRDRMAIVAPGSSHWTRITPTLEVDMSSVPRHIFVDEYLFHYGRVGGHDGGRILAVNQAVTDDGITYFATKSASDVCEWGDSGGPVYFYQEPPLLRLPKGIVISAVPGNNCYFLSIDDQLAGTTWTLK